MRSVIPREIYENKPLEIAREKKINATPIKVSNSDFLYSVGNDVYFDNYLVHPEVFAFLRIPFAFLVSIHFSSESARLSESEIPRRKVVNRLIDHINSRVLAKRFALEPVCREARAVWNTEFGRDRNQTERHCHILFHLHPKTPADVAPEICRYLSSLSEKQLEWLGISDIDAQVIKGRPQKLVSYFCKKEPGRDFKNFEFSNRFRAIALKKFLCPGVKDKQAAKNNAWKAMRLN
jgi:hypothetical protein